MSRQEMRYDAFISYRHAELDKFAAETLHKELEAFRLPKNVIKKWDENEGIKKTKINRVFRDRDELPIASNLADPITLALQNSDFLIVICSPRLPQSLWCKKEIETFIKMHGREKVLAVLIEGEPQDSFPIEILHDENGNAVEPLAADVRGNSKREIKKKIKQEVIRLAAPMFEVGYDELKQRHREQKLKKIITASVAGASVCFAFGAVSTTMALRIHSQSEEIAKQAVKIEEQYTQALQTNAKSMAEDSLRLLKEGNRRAAISKAVEALPTDTETLECPYTPEAQYALTESLYVYENGYQILPNYILEQETSVDFIKLSPEKDRLLVVDIYGKIYVWDVLEREKLCEIESDENAFLMGDTKVAFLDNNRIIYPIQSGFVVYDLYEKKELYKNETCSLSNVDVSDNATCFSIMNAGKITVFRADDYQEIYSCEEEQAKNLHYKMAFSPNADALAFAVESDESGAGETSLSVTVVDLKTKMPKQEYVLTNKKLQQMLFTEDEFYIVVYEQLSGKEESILSYKARGEIYSYSRADASKENWRYATEKGSILEIKEIVTDSGDYLMYRCYSYLGMLDNKQGEFIDGIDYAGEVVDFTHYGKNALVEVITRNGEYHYFNVDTRMDFSFTDKFVVVSDNIRTAHKGDGYWALLSTASHQDTKVTIYTVARGNELSLLYNGNAFSDKMIVNNKETEVAFVQGEEIILYDLKGRKEKHRWMAGDLVQSLSYYGEQQNIMIAVLGKKIIHYDCITGKILKEIPVECSLFEADAFLENGTKIIFDNYKDMIVMNTNTGEIESKVDYGNDLDKLGIYGIGREAGLVAIASKPDMELKLFRIGEKVCEVSAPIRATAVTALNFSEKDKKIYITYLDNKVEVYYTENLSLIRTYTDFQDEVETVSYSEKTGNTILSGISESYILDNNQDVIARVDELNAVLENTQEYIMNCSYNIYTVPMYDLPKLLEEAKKQNVW